MSSSSADLSDSKCREKQRRREMLREGALIFHERVSGVNDFALSVSISSRVFERQSAAAAGGCWRGRRGGGDDGERGDGANFQRGQAAVTHRPR